MIEIIMRIYNLTTCILTATVTIKAYICLSKCESTRETTTMILQGKLAIVGELKAASKLVQAASTRDASKLLSRGFSIKRTSAADTLPPSHASIEASDTFSTSSVKPNGMTGCIIA